MKFFLPAAESPSQAESTYQSIAAHVSAPPQARRIHSLSWRHQESEMNCQIGEPLPAYYQTATESVVAIFDCGSLYKACTHSRGVATGDGVFIGKHSTTRVEYFDDET